ncbi:MAG: DinB family protein [Planctomycetota bacterium]
MNARTLELSEHLARGRSSLLSALDGIASADRDRQPAPAVWSATQVLAHLGRTEGQIAAFLRRMLYDAGDLPAASDSALPVLQSMPGQDLLLDRVTRYEAPEFAQPDPTLDFERAFDNCRRVRDRLQDLVDRTDNFDTSAMQQEHHVFGMLQFDHWIAFAGFHEQRHAGQLRELAVALRG